MTSDQTSYYIGDPVQVSDQEGEYYGVVVGVAEELTVQMISKQANHVWHITSSEYLVPRSSVVQHKPLHGRDEKAPAAYHELGFRMLDGGSFVRLSDDNGNKLLPIGDPEFEVLSDDGEDSFGSLEDFIVPDHECEPFTQADSSDPFVAETHSAVRAFNDWVPATEQEASAREFIVQQESRAVRIDDDIRFAQGKGSVPYSRPM